jgi:DNA polymerase-3 subunit delta
LNQNAFFKSIKAGDIRPVYALLGAEDWLKRRAVDMLRLAIVPAGLEPFNFVRLGEGAALPELTAACDTLPYMNGRRLVVASCDGLFQKDAEGLAAYLEKFPDACCLVLLSGDAKTKLPKALNGLVEAVVFEKMSEDLNAKYLVQQAGKEGVELSVKLAALLVRMAGEDMERAENELEKVCAYALAGNALTQAALERLVTPVAEYNVFAMIDMFFAGRTGQGMRLLSGMLENGESPLGICSLLAGRFRAMLRARALLDGGASAETAARAIGGSPYAAQKAVSASRSQSFAALRRAYELLLTCDVRIKSGHMPQQTALEHAVLKIFAG